MNRQLEKYFNSLKNYIVASENIRFIIDEESGLIKKLRQTLINPAASMIHARFIGQLTKDPDPAI